MRVNNNQKLGAPVWRLHDVEGTIKANVALSKTHKDSAMPSDPLLNHTYQIWSLIDSLWGTPPEGIPKWQIDEGSKAMDSIGMPA